VVEDHRLPLVHANVMIKSGWAEDPKGKPATAALTAELLNEGTKKRNALQISDVARRLGAVLGTNSSFDASVVGLNVLKKNFDPALALLSDILLNPTFPQDELERQRALYLGRIDQETKQPVRAAVKTFQRLLFGPDHPYAQPYTGSGTKDSITNIARNDLVNYYRAHYLPNNAAIVVVGDITLKDAKAKLEKSLKSWKQGVVKKNDITTPAPPPETMVYLVDKPGAPQSTIIAGHLGTRRDDPDYLAKTMANAAFGGQFTSRLNLNLREDKGYSYGVGSLFLETVGVGPYLVYTNVEASTTDESIKEIVKEMKDVVGSRPFTEIEVADAKGNLIRSFPHGFQAYEDMANSLSDLVVFDLSLDEWQTYIPRLNAITTATASSAAKDLFKPEALVIVVVGDKQIIESDLKKLNLGAVMYSSP